MTGYLAGRDVAVIGAGIAGLTAALSLAQRGAVVTVHERASALREVGAGIQISPNAARALAALGLEGALLSASTPARRVVLRRPGGQAVATLDLARRRPGAVFRFILRARLQGLLADAARAAGVTIRFGSTGGDAPLIVGADGIHSTTRTRLNGPGTARFTGQTAWRALVPDDPDPAPEAQVFMGPGRHLVSYPLAGGLRNIVAVLEAPDWTAESWVEPGDPADLRAAFAGFGGPVPGWLAHVEDCGRWGLFRHPIAPRWQDGHSVLIGDAAHPMLPFLAQGACTAIEDGFRLALHLDAAPQPEALAAFEAERRPRIPRIVAAAEANARNYHLTGPHRLAAHGALRLGSRVAPGVIFNRFAWVYDYDPTAPLG